jgi:hypothetical protein
MKRTALSILCSGISLLAMPEIGKADDTNIYDTKKVLIGTRVFDNTLNRVFSDGVLRDLSFFREGLAVDAEFFYQSNNCTGQRLIYYPITNGETPVVQNAMYEDEPSPGTPISNGKTIWGIGPKPQPQMIQFGSAWSFQAPCGVGNGQSYPFVPAVQLDTLSKGFSPPFCAAKSPVACK